MQFPLLRMNTKIETALVHISPLDKAKKPFFQSKPIEILPINEDHIEIPATFSGLQFDYVWKSSLPSPFTIGGFLHALG